MADYSVEIAALEKAIATGATRVTYENRTVEYASFESLLARLRYLKSVTNGGAGYARPASAGFATFDRGDC